MNLDNHDNAGSSTVILIVISMVQFLTPFMFSAVGVALPTIGREFSATAVHLGLIEMVYILAVALFLLPVGRYADIYGRKKIFISGAAIITMATFILSLTSTIETFILFRFIQGIGAAMITSSSLAILTSVVPKESRGKAMGIIVCCVYLGLSAGPTLAGVMTTYFGWRWIFYTAVPIEFFALILAKMYLKGEWKDAAGAKFDWLGSVIYMGGLSCLIIGITYLNEYQLAKWLALTGCFCIAFFCYYQLKTSSPLLALQELVQNRLFAYSNLATLINYAASFGVIFFFSIYLQAIKGLSPMNTGLILAIQPLIQAFISPIAGRLADKYAPDKMATLGMVACSIALFLSATLTAQSSYPMIAFSLCLLGSGFGFFSTPNTTAVMASVNKQQYGIASSMIATMRAIGMLVSMTIITLGLTIFLGDKPVTEATSPAFIRCMQTSLQIFAVASIGGIILSIGRNRLSNQTS